MTSAVARAAIDRLNMRAVAIAPAFAATAEHDLHLLAQANPDIEKQAALAARHDMLAAFGFGPGGFRAEKPFAFADGVAVIPVTGMLLNRFGCSWGNYATGYNFIRSQMNAAAEDPDVKLIVFDVNSYGGEVAGCFELSDDIFALRGKKPTAAVVDANCYSAAYAVASAAEKLIVTPSGGAGSIGVIAMHASYQAMLADSGVKITMIYSGEHKADGNPYHDLPEDVRANIQADVDYSRQKFAEVVARNRRLDVQAVLNTEARSYRADEAMALGLIDLIAPPSRAVEAITSELSDSSDQPSEITMTVATATPGAESHSAQSQVDTAKLAADARASERQRIASIKALPEAAGKYALADHLALNTGLSVDEAKGILAAAPSDGQGAAAPAAAAQTAAVFDAAMTATGNPQVGADAAAAPAAQPASKAAAILAAHTAATGQRHTQ